MAKIFKVREKRRKDLLAEGEGWKHIYPAGFNNAKAQIVAHEASMFPAKVAEVRARTPQIGDVGIEDCIYVVADIDAPDYEGLDDVTEISREAAIALGSTWYGDVIGFNSEIAIHAILNKIQRSEALDQTDLDAINPDSLQAGRIRSKSFTKKLDEEIAKKDA